MIDIESGVKTYLAEVGKVIGPPQPGGAPDWTIRRAQLEKIANALSPPRPSGLVAEDQWIVGPERWLAARLYRPASPGAKPLLLFFHGGGWVIGSIETHDYLAAILAEAIDCVVVSVEYRRAPEHPYPAILADCYDALNWARDNWARLGIDPAKIAVAGDSAGAHLSACCAMRAAGAFKLAFQLLIYPMIGPEFQRDSYTQFAQAPGLTRADAVAFWRAAFGEDLTDVPAFALPAQADPHVFPPTYVLSAEFDPLRDEGEAYAGRLRAAGRPVVLRRADRMIHGFMRAVPFSPPARDELDGACAWARTMFAAA